MKDYARRQASVLLRRLASQIASAERLETPDSVHDLRTGIRRLSECLRTFDVFFPNGEAAKLRRELKQMMDLAGDVRNRDIAEKLFTKSGALPTDKFMVKLSEEHTGAREALAAKIKASRDFSLRCRGRLKL